MFIAILRFKKKKGKEMIITSINIVVISSEREK